MDKGARISTAASDGMSQAGQHGAPGSAAAGATVDTPNDGGTGTADEASDGASESGTDTADESSDGASEGGSGNAGGNP